MTDSADQPPESTNSFYNLLFSDPIQTLTDNKTSVDDNYISPDYSDSFYGPNPPKMLCFGGYKKEEEAICSEITAATIIKQMVCQSESSSASSANDIETSSNPNRKRNGSGQNSVNVTVELVNGVSQYCKRGKSDKTAAGAAAHAKPRMKPKPARKEKIGERIATLQQLVSPFGKTDTASVLQEAFCYIKFLHDQIHVLSSPYLHQLSPIQELEGLKSRGLCLVPVAYTAELASANGTDYWASAGIETESNNLGLN